MKVPLYNIEGKEIGSALLPKEIVDVNGKADVGPPVAVSHLVSRLLLEKNKFCLLTAFSASYSA